MCVKGRRSVLTLCVAVWCLVAWACTAAGQTVQSYGSARAAEDTDLRDLLRMQKQLLQQHRALLEKETSIASLLEKKIAAEGIFGQKKLQVFEVVGLVCEELLG